MGSAHIVENLTCLWSSGDVWQIRLALDQLLARDEGEPYFFEGARDRAGLPRIAVWYGVMEWAPEDIKREVAAGQMKRAHERFYLRIAGHIRVDESGEVSLEMLPHTLSQFMDLRTALEAHVGKVKGCLVPGLEASLPQ